MEGKMRVGASTVHASAMWSFTGVMTIVHASALWSFTSVLPLPCTPLPNGRLQARCPDFARVRIMVVYRRGASTVHASARHCITVVYRCNAPTVHASALYMVVYRRNAPTVHASALWSFTGVMPPPCTPMHCGLLQACLEKHCTCVWEARNAAKVCRKCRPMEVI